ncbi:hypothetical protein D3C78_1408280 [compost metagenome]
MHGGMGNPRARLEHDAGHRTDRDVHAYAVLIDHHEGAVQHVDLTVLNEHHRHPVLHRQGLEGREHQLRATLSKPQPKALAGPMPVARARLKASRLCTWSTPSKQARCTLMHPSPLRPINMSLAVTKAASTLKPWRSPCRSSQASCSPSPARPQRLPWRVTVGLACRRKR